MPTYHALDLLGLYQGSHFHMYPHQPANRAQTQSKRKPDLPLSCFSTFVVEVLAPMAIRKSYNGGSFHDITACMFVLRLVVVSIPSFGPVNKLAVAYILTYIPGCQATLHNI